MWITMDERRRRVRPSTGGGSRLAREPAGELNIDIPDQVMATLSRKAVVSPLVTPVWKLRV